MSRVQSWERRTEVPLLLLALAFLIAYAWPILDPRMDETLDESLTVVSWTVWAAFFADFAIRVGLADERGRYVVRHWYDVALIGLPMLRPLRLLRVLAFARLLSRSAARTFGDALWWAFTTVTTVGYGDRYPVTVSGRLAAVALTIVGLALVGSVTAATAAWFIHHVQAERTSTNDEDEQPLKPAPPPAVSPPSSSPRHVRPALDDQADRAQQSGP